MFVIQIYTSKLYFPNLFTTILKIVVKTSEKQHTTKCFTQAAGHFLFSQALYGRPDVKHQALAATLCEQSANESVT